MSKTTHLDVLNCGDCPLHMIKEGGRCLAIPLQPSTVDIMVIGDSPTMPELVSKESFSGKGSVFFRKALEAVIEAWNKGQAEPLKPKIHYTYSVLCQQKEEPPAKAIAQCNARLRKEVEELKPKVIIALGNGAMRSLGYTRAGILQMRGQRKWDTRLNAYVMATFHPQYVLTNTGVFETWTNDLTKALWMLKRTPGQQYEPPKTKVDILTTTSQAKNFLRQLRSKPRHVASDIETRGFDFKKDELLCSSFTFKKGHSVVIAEEVILDPDLHEELKLTMESKNITWIYHNGKFDNKFFWAQKGIESRTDIDTMLMHYCIDVRKGTHDLEQVAMEYCDAEPWEHIVHKYVVDSFADIPRPILYQYAGVDTDMTYRIWEAMEELFEAERRKGRKIDRMFELLSDASNAYLRLELAGFKADLSYVEQLAAEYEPLLEQYAADMVRYAHEAGWDPKEYAQWADIQKLADWEQVGKKTGKKRPGPTKVPNAFNPNSYMHVRYLLFGIWGLKPIRKKGKITSDSDSLKIYQERLRDVTGIKFIDVKLKYAADKKLYGTYVKGIWKHIDMDTHRVHSTFNLHGTETGRLSSSNPNIHNIPRNSKIKNIFIPEKGYVLLQGDYSQAELRVMAVEGGDAWLQNVYKMGSDLHDQMSVQLFGPDFTSEERNRSKAVNFGIPYGRTEYTLAAEHGMTVPEARKLIKDWYAPQPGTHRFMMDRREDPIEGRVYETPLGRIRPFGLITERNRNAVQNEAGNFPIQSTASDLTVWSVNRLVERLDELNERLGFTAAVLVNTVHDSIIAEVKAEEEILLEVRAIFRDVMESAGEVLLETDVPFKTDFEVGLRWGDLYEFDEVDGRIVIQKKTGDQTFDEFYAERSAP